MLTKLVPRFCLSVFEAFLGNVSGQVWIPGKAGPRCKRTANMKEWGEMQRAGEMFTRQQEWQ